MERAPHSSSCSSNRANIACMPVLQPLPPPSLPSSQQSTQLVKKYPCAHCSSGFSRIDNLKRHILSVHLGLRLHKCTFPGCVYAASTQHALKVHCENSHIHCALSLGLKPAVGGALQCTSPGSCLLSSKRALPLFKCLFKGCDFASRRKFNLRNHMNVMHLGQKRNASQLHHQPLVATPPTTLPTAAPTPTTLPNAGQ